MGRCEVMAVPSAHLGMPGRSGCSSLAMHKRGQPCLLTDRQTLRVAIARPMQSDPLVCSIAFRDASTSSWRVNQLIALPPIQWFATYAYRIYARAVSSMLLKFGAHVLPPYGRPLEDAVALLSETR